MNKSPSGHPEYEELLALIDDDRFSNVSTVKRHVRECARCQQEIADTSATMREYARFEQTVIAAAIAPPDQPWLDLRAAMREMDAGQQRPTVRVTAGSGRLGRLGGVAGRIVAGGTAVGCLAFALVVLNHFPARREGKTAPTLPGIAAVPKTPPKIESRRDTGVPPPGPVDGAPPAMEAPANTEVRVWAALHRLGADLGEPVEVEVRPDGRIAVGGTGLPPSRQSAIREALANASGVVVRFGDAPVAEARPGSPAERFEAAHSPLEAQLRRYAGADAAYQSLSDSVLDESDTVLAHAHALRTLAQRFPPWRQAEVRPAERALLLEMAADHQEAFRDHARKLLDELTPLAKALDAPPAPAPTASNPLDAAQRMDHVLSAIFGAARSDLKAGQLLAELAAASASLAAAAGDAQ